jgi:hypothetical protein
LARPLVQVASNMLNYPLFFQNVKFFIIFYEMLLRIMLKLLLLYWKIKFFYLKLEYSTGNLSFSTGKIIHEIKINSTGKIVILYMTAKQQPIIIIDCEENRFQLQNI